MKMFINFEPEKVWIRIICIDLKYRIRDTNQIETKLVSKIFILIYLEQISRTGTETICSTRSNRTTSAKVLLILYLFLTNSHMTFYNSKSALFPRMLQCA